MLKTSGGVLLSMDAAGDILVMHQRILQRFRDASITYAARASHLRDMEQLVNTRDIAAHTRERLTNEVLTL